MHERMFVPSSKIHTNNVFAPFYKSMDPSSKILYGGFEGTTADVCENTKSLGEFILKKFEEIGNKILLVNYLSFSISLVSKCVEKLRIPISDRWNIKS